MLRVEVSKEEEEEREDSMLETNSSAISQRVLTGVPHSLANLRMRVLVCLHRRSCFFFQFLINTTVATTTIVVLTDATTTTVFLILQLLFFWYPSFSMMFTDRHS